MKTEIHPVRLLVKALLLFILINIIYAVIDPPIYGVSTYNLLFPGRVRFPFGEGSDPYTVAVDDLDVMMASHAIAAAKDAEEYRVVIIGDSSIWGEGLTPEQSISGQWNQLNNQCNNRKLKFYNLGYPHPSAVKDLMILERAMEYDPDMIVWFVTLNTLVPLQVSSFLTANRERAVALLDTYDIPFENEDQLLPSDPGFYAKTLVGRRSELARAIKLQTLGLIWSAIGTDTYLSASPDAVPLSPDVKDDLMYKGMKPEDDLRSEILIDALIAGHEIAESRPILIVNEPIFIATGENKDLRYNHAYPRWAYDYYRDVMNSESEKHQWNYLDLWDAVPVDYFADVRFHVSAQGEQLIVQQTHPVLQSIACQ